MRSRPRECRDCFYETLRKCPSQTREAVNKRVREWVRRGGPKVEAHMARKNAARRRGPYREREDRHCRECACILTPENNKPCHGRFCRDCRNKRNAMLTTKEHRAAENRAWRRSNRERVKHHQATFHAAHPEARSVYVHRYKAKWGPARESGDLTRAQWLARLEEFGHACAYCLRTDLPLTQDHMQPISRGGRHTIDNIVPACQPCNSTKHDYGVLRMVASMIMNRASGLSRARMRPE